MSPPLCLWGSCGHATPLRFYILETSVPGGGVQQWVLLCRVTLSQMQDLGSYQVAQLSCEKIDLTIWSLPEIMTSWPQAGSKEIWRCILTYPWSLWWEQEILHRRLYQEIRKGIQVGLRPSHLLPPGDFLLCRESHTFPRADLGISGHIEKLEFHIMILVTVELEYFSITEILMSHNDN